MGYAGPLPDPLMFQAYENALPGAADRILSMAEGEQGNRHASNKNERRMKAWGLALGSLLGVGVIGMCIYAIHEGHPEVVSSVLYSSAALIAVIVGGRVLQQRFQK